MTCDLESGCTLRGAWLKPLLGPTKITAFRRRAIVEDQNQAEKTVRTKDRKA